MAHKIGPEPHRFLSSTCVIVANLTWLIELVVTVGWWSFRRARCRAGTTPEGNLRSTSRARTNTDGNKKIDRKAFCHMTLLQVLFSACTRQDWGRQRCVTNLWVQEVSLQPGGTLARSLQLQVSRWRPWLSHGWIFLQQRCNIPSFCFNIIRLEVFPSFSSFFFNIFIYDVISSLLAQDGNTNCNQFSDRKQRQIPDRGNISVSALDIWFSSRCSD